MAWNIYGKAINNAIFGLPKKFPFLKVYQHCTMPDHVHVFIWVMEKTKKHLGHYIGQLKDKIGKEISRKVGCKISGADIFMPNYTDKIVYWGIDFNVIFQYIRENPHRLAMRMQFPENFQRVDEIRIGDQLYSAYGNQFLLSNPFKDSVVIHRSNTAEENENLEYDWLRTAEGGGVLVSPFISKAEKRIRDLAEFAGGKFILIQSEPFGERFKPARHNFELCSQGRLLIIAPKFPMERKGFRDKCLEMNKLAEELAKREF